MKLKFTKFEFCHEKMTCRSELIHNVFNFHIGRYYKGSLSK